MEERMLHILSLIAGQVRTKQQLFSDEGRIMDSLTSSGFRVHEVDAALTLLQSLAQGAAALPGMRTMSTEERRRFTVDAFALVCKFAVLGVITEEQREDIVERALGLHGDRIGVEDIRTLLALALFGAEGAAEASETGPSVRDTVWN